ncbi:hypothetical protein L6475_03975 [Prevotella sp. E9-3]|uniref:hypothetical protein n=1 Tax=Prevotella sp. E9-3 TaxID=2913621 RepID=UPI001ED9F213|nr:hypothetical protein [Prevotella sp. E9-3]UKK49126.1 hypothetical protein L6475_03975 [Prevotella sp. E9-3]
MKQNLKTFFLTALLSLAVGSAWAIEPVDGVYKIGSAQDWSEFCTLHNEGANQNLNAELTADVTVEGNAMVGINGGGKPYRGVFDGKGHKLTISYNLNEERVAPFRRINGATIKNLIVEGTITTTSKLASGLVGGLWQNGTTIQNCISYVVITDDQGGDATHGGICGSFEDVNGANTIENCAFLGEINAPNREGCGGIVGWTNNNNSNNIIRNCLVNAAGFNVKTGSNNDIICRNNGNVVNCYYIGSIDGMRNDKGATAATTEQAESGELCYILNGKTSTNVGWFQTIGVDNIPLPIGTAVVYANGELRCDGITPKPGSELTFSNVDGSTIDPHDYVDGICSFCHDLQLVAGVYQIGCADALIRFAEIVNSGNGTANAVLTKNIDMTDKSWTPIGQDGKDFAGHFDGQNFRIQNLVVNNLGAYDNQALFGQVVGTAVIENVIMDASCSIKGKEHVAGILGHVWGHGAIIRNCVNEAYVESSGSQAAGIVATAERKVFIQNCVNKGAVKSNSNSAAGILARVWGDGTDTEVTNCTNEGTITGTGGEIGGIVASLNKAITVSNCRNTGSVNGTGSFTGGVVGRIWSDNVIVQNCGNEGAVTGGGANAAGIVGCSGNIVKILNCYNLGNIIGGNESAAICGWMGAGSSELKNCYSTGTVTGIDGTNYLIRKTDIIRNNNYQLAGMPGDQGTSFAAADLASGKLAYLLNGSKSTDVAWYQNLGAEADDYPLPWGTAIVYKNGDLYCDGSSKGSESYSNIEGSNRDEHHFVNGFCDNVNGSSVVCDELDLSFMTPSEGYYQVSTARQLRWTAAVSQESANAGIKVKLLNNIDMAGEKFDGFGSNDSEANRFKGEIDGQRHIISNLKMDFDRNGVGLVNTATVGAIISNLTIASSCEFKGQSAVAAFIGAVRGTSGDLYIRNCGNEGLVTATGANGAGFVGCKYDDDVIPNLTNCYNVGEIHSSNDGGSFSGWMPKAVLTNCYSIVSPDNGYGFQEGNQFGRGWSQAINHCYDYGTGDWGQNNGTWGAAFIDGRKITVVDESSMTTMFAGLLAYNEGGVDGSVWRMGDDHPVLYGNQIAMREDCTNRIVEGNFDVKLYRTLKADKWNTFVVPFDLSTDELKAAFGDGVEVAEYSETADAQNAENSIVTFSSMATPEITANVPVMLKSANSGVFSFTGRTVKAGDAIVAGNANFDFVGSYNKETVVAENDYYLSDNKIFKSLGNGSTISATRAYIKTKDGSNARIASFFIDGEGQTTGIVNAKKVDTKDYYNLNGQRVDKAQMRKGLYIRDGRKMVVK